MKRNLFKTLCLIFALFISACQSNSKDIQQPNVSKGQIDLTEWRLSVDGELKLDGDWALYWKKLINFDDLTSSTSPQPDSFYPFPNTWNGYQLGGEELTGIGFGTFVLKLTLADSDVGRPLALKVGDLDTAFKLSINGQLVGASGTVGMDRENSEPRTMAVLMRYTPEQHNNTLVLQISNFDYHKGGPWSSLVLGTDQHISEAHAYHVFINTLMIGSILIMALYHVVLAFLRKEDKSPLYFGAFCLLIAVRSMITGDRYLLEVFPFLSYDIAIKLEFLTFYLAVPAFFAYLYSLYPKEITTIPFKIVLGIGGILSLIVLFTPPIIFGRTLPVYQLFTVAAGVHISIAITLALIRKREGAWVIAIGFLILFGAAINDILHANEIVHTAYFISAGFVVFIFSQAYLISFRFAKAFNTVEVQKDELIFTNSALVKQIDENNALTISLQESHQQFQDSRIGLILGLAKLAEYRDEDTGMHLERMREYTRLLALEMSKMADFKDYITKEYIQDIYQSAILHDIGKVGVKDAVLLKPGKLTEDEFELIKTHAAIGGNAIRDVESKTKIRSFLTLGRDIAYYHHEKWDGTGYPFQKKGEEIPLSARIVALADVYDALTSERPYKKPFSHEKATGIIVSSSGTHFDPVVVDAFQKAIEQFNSIRTSLQE